MMIEIDRIISRVMVIPYSFPRCDHMYNKDMKEPYSVHTGHLDPVRYKVTL